MFPIRLMSVSWQDCTFLCGIGWFLPLFSFCFRKGLISIGFWPLLLSSKQLHHSDHYFFVYFLLCSFTKKSCELNTLYFTMQGDPPTLILVSNIFFFNFYFLWIENLIKLMYFNKKNPCSLPLISSIPLPQLHVFSFSLFCLNSPGVHLALIWAWLWDPLLEHGIVTLEWEYWRITP